GGDQVLRGRRLSGAGPPGRRFGDAAGIGAGRVDRGGRAVSPAVASVVGDHPGPDGGGAQANTGTCRSVRVLKRAPRTGSVRPGAATLTAVRRGGEGGGGEGPQRRMTFHRCDVDALRRTVPGRRDFHALRLPRRRVPTTCPGDVSRPLRSRTRLA